MSNFNTTINTCGSSGYHTTIGSTGHQGSAYSIMSDIEDTIEKYNNRFLLKDYKVSDSMKIILTIVDNFTFKEHIFEANTMINLTKDLESFITDIISTDRDMKIDNIINE
jgi:hypothetical protein